MPLRKSFAKGTTTADTRITTCTDCRYGIFKSHKYKWTERGLVHIDCADKVGMYAVTNAS